MADFEVGQTDLNCGQLIMSQLLNRSELWARSAEKLLLAEYEKVCKISKLLMIFANESEPVGVVPPRRGPLIVFP